MKRKNILHICIGLLLAAMSGYFLYQIVRYGMSLWQMRDMLPQEQRYQIVSLFLSNCDRQFLLILTAVLMLRRLVRKGPASGLIVSGVLVLYIFLLPIAQEWWLYRTQSIYQAEGLSAFVNTMSGQTGFRWYSLLRLIPGLLLIFSGMYWRRFAGCHADEISETWPFFRSVSVKNEEAEE